MYTQSLCGETVYKYKLLGTIWPMDLVFMSTFNDQSMSIGCVGKLGHLSGFLRHYLLTVITQLRDNLIQGTMTSRGREDKQRSCEGQDLALLALKTLPKTHHFPCKIVSICPNALKFSASLVQDGSRACVYTQYSDVTRTCAILVYVSTITKHRETNLFTMFYQSNISDEFPPSYQSVKMMQGGNFNRLGMLGVAGSLCDKLKQPCKPAQFWGIPHTCFDDVDNIDC